MSIISFMDSSGNITSYEKVKDVSVYFTCQESYDNVIMWCKTFKKRDPVASMQLFTIELLSESYVDETVKEVLQDLTDKKSYYHSILNEKEIEILSKIYENFDFYKVRYADIDFG